MYAVWKDCTHITRANWRSWCYRFNLSCFPIAKKKIGLSSRIALQESMDKDTMQDIVKFIKKTIVLTLLIEGIGALLLLYSTITYTNSF